MKKSAFKSFITIATFLTTATTITVASAHEAAGTLGAAAGAIDIYQTTCSKSGANKTSRFVTHVKTKQKTPLVSIQAYKGKLASNSTDTTGGDTKFSADGIIKGGGEGVYTVLVDKSGAGAVNYQIEAHCYAAGTTHSGQTEPETLQNQ